MLKVFQLIHPFSESKIYLCWMYILNQKYFSSLFKSKLNPPQNVLYYSSVTCEILVLIIICFLFGSQTLYVKNLSGKVHLEDLKSLFDKFSPEGSGGLEYRVLTGRMRGQAFITFPGKSTAASSYASNNPKDLQCNVVIKGFYKFLILFVYIFLYLQMF